MSLETAQIGMLQQTYKALGAAFPKPVAKALEDRAKITTLTVYVASNEEMADALFDCLLADRDPLNDEHVRRLACSRAIAGASPSGGEYGIGLAADRHVATALTENVDSILATLRKAATKAGQTLTDAHRILGDLDLGDSEAILRMGPDAARCWAEAKGANSLLRHIDQAWMALAGLTHFASTSIDPTSRLADLTLEQFEKLGRKAEPWHIVQAGGVIDLVDAQGSDRSARLNAERQERQDAGAGAFTDAYRRTHGTGIMPVRIR